MTVAKIEFSHQKEPYQLILALPQDTPRKNMQN